MIKLKNIGWVESDFLDPTDPNIMKKYVSTIIIHEEYEEGLYRIEENEYLQVLFTFHLNKDYELKDNTYDGTQKGIFASRSSYRPNAIGLTKVKLIERRGRQLIVIGLDALNGSPVLDIKPYNLKMDEEKLLITLN